MEKIRDVCKGADAVKAAGNEYLPFLDPSDKSARNKKRNADYIQRAVFYAITGNTKVGLLGLAFRKDPTMTAPDKLNYLRDNADGAGASIYQQSQQVTENILEAARGGFIRIMQLRPTRRSSFVIRRKASLTGAPNASMDVINWCWWFYVNAWKRKMVLRTRMKSSIANWLWRTESLSAGYGESQLTQALFPSILSITRSLKVRILG